MGRREQPNTSRRGTLRNTLGQNLHQNGSKAYSKVQTKLPHRDAPVNCFWSETTFPNMMDNLIVFSVQVSPWRDSPSHGRKRWRRLTGKGRGARRTHSVVQEQTQYYQWLQFIVILNIFCMHIHLCLCYVQLCITMFFVFHMVLRTAIYNYRLHCGRNKNHFYKICDSVIYISFL